MSSDASISQTLRHEIEYKAKKQKEREIALNLIQKGYSDDTIKDATGLADQDIQILRDSLSNQS